MNRKRVPRNVRMRVASLAGPEASRQPRAAEAQQLQMERLCAYRATSNPGYTRFVKEKETSCHGL
eukprot:11192336-Lingulodinium_polyedra.AAC.1